MDAHMCCCPSDNLRGLWTNVSGLYHTREELYLHPAEAGSSKTEIRTSSMPLGVSRWTYITRPVIMVGVSGYSHGGHSAETPTRR